MGYGGLIETGVTSDGKAKPAATTPSGAEPLDLTRSAKMCLIQFYIPSEAAQVTMSEMGEMGLVQFRDLNEDVPPHKRTFTPDLIRLSEMERKVKLLVKAAEESDVMIHSRVYLASHGSGSPTLRTNQELAEQDVELTELEKRVGQMRDNIKSLESNLEALQERRSVLLQVNHLLMQHQQGVMGPYYEQAPAFIQDPLGQDQGYSAAYAPPAASFFPDNLESGINGQLGFAPPMGPPHSPTTQLNQAMSQQTYQPVLYGQQPMEQEYSSTSYQQQSSPMSHIKFVVGVIEKKKFVAFERVMWRAMRGNVFISKADIFTYGGVHEPQPTSDSSEAPTNVLKTAFIIFGHGGAAMMGKIERICRALGCRIFPEIGEDTDGRRMQIGQVDAQINDLTSILFNTRQTCRSELARIAETLDDLRRILRRQRAISAVMNLLHFDGMRKCLIGEGWVEASKIPIVDESLQRSSERMGLDVSSILTVLKTDLIPPTHFPSTKFTQVFQEMNDAYGIADYREYNPALPLMITFPFLFSLMFGDVGHAVLMILGAVIMCWWERPLERTARTSEMFGLIFSGRYIILLMGLFSLYSGMLYNDCFSKSMSIFPSMFEIDSLTGIGTRRSATYVYPFGLDYLWNHATNNLNFTNSIKMKLSIICAVLHMNYGLALGASNALAEGDWAGLLCHSLPQFLFFNCLFGYMAFLILYKWMYPGLLDVSILNTFIAMVMRAGAVEGNQQVFWGQLWIQRGLMSVAMLAVPWMIFGRPLLGLWRRKQIQALGYQETNRHSSGESLRASKSSPSNPNEMEKPLASKAASPSESAASLSSPSGHQPEEEGFGSQMIQEAIHAIEFVLGCVSNTASYLRLWALSLAHAQLSEVLWSLCLEGFMGNVLALTVGYVIWFFGTLGLMVAMEGLSAFLHALRLHWVEFNNKFYSGRGVKFEPFKLAAEDVGDEDGEAVIIPATQPVQY